MQRATPQSRTEAESREPRSSECETVPDAVEAVSRRVSDPDFIAHVRLSPIVNSARRRASKGLVFALSNPPKASTFLVGVLFRPAMRFERLSLSRRSFLRAMSIAASRPTPTSRERMR